MSMVNAASASILEEALAAYYFPTTGAADVSGHGNDGVLAAGASISEGLLQLDAGYLEIPGAADAMNGEGSWTVLIKRLIAGADNAPLLSAGAESQRDNVNMFTQGSEFGVDVWYVGYGHLSSSVNFTDGTPHDIFITYDTTWKLYNGSSEVGNGGMTYSVPAGKVYIGQSVSAGATGDMGFVPLGGSAEAVAVWDRVLTEAERVMAVASFGNPTVAFGVQSCQSNRCRKQR